MAKGKRGERQPAKPDLVVTGFACVTILLPPVSFFLWPGSSVVVRAAGIHALHASCQLVSELMNLCSLPGDKPGRVQKETGHRLQGNSIPN